MTVAVRAVNLSKSYGAYLALDGVSLIAHKNEVVAILGSSGSGKSTLLRCLNLLETPDAAELSVCGVTVEIGDGKPPAPRRTVMALRRKTAMVFQQFNLWPHWTAMENVANPLIHVHGMPRPEAAAEAEAALRVTGMLDKCHDYPARLSGGQQQRVAIARALAVKPEILLFDEPTSALDPELVNEVLQVMRALAEHGHTMLVVTHEIRFAREVAATALFLNLGKVHETGPIAPMLASPRTPELRKFLGRAA